MCVEIFLLILLLIKAPRYLNLCLCLSLAPLKKMLY